MPYGKHGKGHSMKSKGSNPKKARREMTPKVEKSLHKNGGAKKGK